MLKQLQPKWGVSNAQFLLILCVFAITDTGITYFIKAISSWVGFMEGTFSIGRLLPWVAILMFGYQVISSMVAFFFGQFPFFRKYEKKLLRRISGSWFRVTGEKASALPLFSEEEHVPPAVQHPASNSPRPQSQILNLKS